MKHWEWLEQAKRYKNPEFKCSEHGRAVAQILGITFGGLYHLENKAIEKADWQHECCVEINLWRPQLATHDFCRLTELVIMCHDACIRLEIDPHTFQTLKLWFHKRESREGDICRRHPTIESAIERVRKYGAPKYEERENSQHPTNGITVPATSAVTQTETAS
jgi:hypothetical protein